MLSRKYLFQALLLLLSMPAAAQTLTLVCAPGSPIMYVITVSPHYFVVLSSRPDVSSCHLL